MDAHLLLAFRDALLLHLSLLPSPITTETLIAKLVQAGSTLEYIKYSEQIFELLFVGGLLQPGGSYLDDKRSPVYIIKTDEQITIEGGGETGGESGWKEGVRGMVEVLKRVIQRYKYLQKPLEENFLPDLLGYLHKWDPKSRDKLAEAIALLVLELQCSTRCLQSLSKDHVVKDGVALAFLTSFSRTYLAKQNVELLGSTLRRSGLKDILLVFPLPTRDRKHLEDHFKKENLPAINEWYGKLALSEAKEDTIVNVSRMLNDEDTDEQVSLGSAASLTADHRTTTNPTSGEVRPRSGSMRMDMAGPHEIGRLDSASGSAGECCRPISHSRVPLSSC